MQHSQTKDPGRIVAGPGPVPMYRSRKIVSATRIRRYGWGVLHTEAAVPARLDAIDRHILKELQDDGRMTNVELARRVGISAPPCLRRVRALEEAGYIKGYRALLNEKLLGYEL